MGEFGLIRASLTAVERSLKKRKRPACSREPFIP
jgi:hypothetical protein